MEKVEQDKQYYCDLCSAKNEMGEIVGGRFCVQLSGIPGNREVFTVEQFLTGSRRLFWSCQRKEEIEDCATFQQWAKMVNNINPEAIRQLV